VDEQYVKIGSVEELFQSLQNPGAVILCGGTDLVLKMRKGLLSAKTLLDISDLDQLREIRQKCGCIEIGAAVTFSQIIEEAIIGEQIPILVSWHFASSAPLRSGIEEPLEGT
jgi:CO/xanthine dehydrogenase FAD-binding subunit